jgi:hypothetical protein
MANKQNAKAGFAGAPGSAACPDFWFRYERVDGEEVINTSRNLLYEQVMEIMAGIDRVKATITAGDKWHCPNCDKPHNDKAQRPAN